MNASTLGSNLVKAVIPPYNSSPRAQYWWRIRIALVSAGALFLAVGLTLTAYGANPLLPGFATKNDLNSRATVKSVSDLAGDVRQLTAMLKEQSDETLVRDIRDLRLKYCASNDGLREEYLYQLRNDLAKYLDRKHYSYPMDNPPRCPD